MNHKQSNLRGIKMENDSFKTQVSAVFDMNGQIHPRWCRFKNGLGEIITVESLTVERENSVDDRIQRAFLCSTYMYNRKRYFCLCYNISFHTWTVEQRISIEEYNYLLSHDRSQFR